MARLTRFVLENHCYHVIAATRDRLPLFSDSGFAEIVMEAIQFVRYEKAFVFSFAIMPDHIHLLLVPKTPWTISQVMQSIKGFSSRAINQRRGTRGAIWQQSFYDRVIRDEEQLRSTLAYIHQNPVEHGLVTRAEEYQYSSACPGAATDIEAFMI
jgi:REP element-mobilizing transposase RayT